MKLSTVDLRGQHGVTLQMTFRNVNPKKPFHVVVKEPQNNRPIYERMVNTDKININIPNHPNYVNVIVVGEPFIKGYLLRPLEPIKTRFLPPDLRRKFNLEQIKFVSNPTINTPALINIKTGLVEYNPNILNQYSEEVGIFILFHEMGHYFFDSERKTDRFAIDLFMNRGHNMSQAVYAITRVLYPSPQKAERMLSMLNYLNRVNHKLYHKSFCNCE